jgi:hypothetical protein
LLAFLTDRVCRCDFARHIQDFRACCSHLIFAEHIALWAADRHSHVENCRIWARKAEKQLAALESGQNPLEVRDLTEASARRRTDELDEQTNKAG